LFRQAVDERLSLGGSLRHREKLQLKKEQVTPWDVKGCFSRPGALRQYWDWLARLRDERVDFFLR
jgi:hypothetical protein